MFEKEFNEEYCLYQYGGLFKYEWFLLVGIVGLNIFKIFF